MLIPLSTNSRALCGSISRYYNNAYEHNKIPLFLEDSFIYNNKHKRIDCGCFIRLDLMTHLYYGLVNGIEGRFSHLVSGCYSAKKILTVDQIKTMCIERIPSITSP